MQMWREKTCPPFQEILPEATPRSHCLLRQALSLLAQTHSLGGRRKSRGSFLSIEMSGMCGDYGIERGGVTCKTALAHFTSSIIAGVSILGSTCLHRPGAEMEPSGAAMSQAPVPQPLPPRSW